MIDGKMTLSSAIKLNKLLADIQVRAKKAGLPVDQISFNEDEFGFYFKNKNEYVMFFGCSPTFWKQDAPAFCCVVYKPLFKESFRQLFRGKLGLEFADDDRWVVAGFPNEDLTLGPDHIVQKLSKIWSNTSREVEKKKPSIRPRKKAPSRS